MPAPKTALISAERFRGLANAAAAPLAAVVIGMGILWLENGGWRMPHDFAAAIFGLLTVYAAFAGGMVAGLVCGAAGWTFLAILLSEPTSLFTFSLDDRVRLVMMALALPAASALVSGLVRRIRRDNDLLREAEAVWRLLAEHIPDVVITADAGGTVHYLNRPIPWSGITRAETVGRKVDDFIPKDLREQYRKALPQALSSGEERKLSFKTSAADGSAAWYEMRIGPVRREGRVLAAMIIIADVTQHMHVVEAHRLLDAIVRSSNAAIFSTTADGTITSWNPGAARMYGLEPKEIVGKNIAELIPHGTAAKTVAELIERARRGEERDRIETMHRRWDGSTFTVSLTVSPLGESGRLAGLAIIARDLTAQRRADEEKERSSRLLAEAERIAHVGSWEWDVAAGTMIWTDELYDMYGITARDRVPTLDTYLKQIHTEDREHVKRATLKARDEGVPFSFDHRLIRPDGEMRVLRLHGGVRRDDRGRITHVIGTAHDVTQTRRLEAMLDEHNKHLAREVEERAKALRTESLRLRTVIDEAPTIVWAADAAGIITLSRGRGLSALGLEPDAHVGLSMLDLFKKDERFAADVRRALAGETVVDRVTISSRTFEAYLAPLKGTDGAVIGIICLAVEVAPAEKKKAPRKKKTAP